VDTDWEQKYCKQKQVTMALTEIYDAYMHPLILKKEDTGGR
jgi:hypothetical protein